MTEDGSGARTVGRPRRYSCSYDQGGAGLNITSQGYVRCSEAGGLTGYAKYGRNGGPVGLRLGRFFAMASARASTLTVQFFCQERFTA
jgi:hypothetical protein